MIDLSRGEMLMGKDRQMPVEQPYPQQVQQPIPVAPVEQPTPTPQPTTQPTKEPTMGRRFTAIDDFHSEEFNCDYVAGLSYEARDEDEKLLGLLDKWIDEGKVREGGPVAEVSGGGEVKDEDDDE